MLGPEKRKSTENPETSASKRSPVNCILHSTTIQHGDFISFSNVKVSAEERLNQLHDIM